ncbi:bifunctional 5,10-methylene-tetrahydrofolate dehydrogenase/ 5,10-methylene-tetrahydrofolate cyclohydrolase [Candidatus Omnitrophus magneticus]|uniref:Bifunctional protein FolD n=1 Tax=Candidatus Omnitrophus magneticus TaxID=1609969 RepID=A0A0F0CP80_9BACT|nr:bifunctional 5,10-methylene-tetrahydrofolate dehydrogenase/ 5,10-methylene-tetrahydrofolate cyclohydrolase [Candidatus Omnitrophus magneticus]
MEISDKIIDCRLVADNILKQVKEESSILSGKYGIRPKLVSIISGDKESSKIYVSSQKKTAQIVGIDFEICEIGESATQLALSQKIDELNNDKSVTSIIIQHPLACGIEYEKIIPRVNIYKDAEATHPYNLGMILRGDAKLMPCTPGAVMEILNSKGIDLYGKDITIIGHSSIVGKPLAMLLLNKTATVSVCHIGTARKGDIKRYTSNADILIVAVGKANMVDSSWIKEGAVVVDVGINNFNGKVTGDVDFDDTIKKASFITKVPGGVGPVTVSILMRNVLESYKAQYEKF